MGGAFQALSWYLLSAATAPPDVGPHEYCEKKEKEKKEKKEKKKKCLVFLGDSITHQRLSGPFCDMVQSERPDIDVVNCGQNSILTYTVLKERVQWVAACNPDYVSVMIGERARRSEGVGQRPR